MDINICTKLNELGYKTVPQSFYTNIAVWKSWYKGRVDDFHKYTVFNGQKKVECMKCTAGLAKKACEDWADLMMNEKVKITLEGQKEQEFVDDVFEKNNFRQMSNQFEELAFALGTTATVARVKGMRVNEEGYMNGDGAKGLLLDFVMADGIYPIAWENGIIDECAFATSRVLKNKKYVYLQIHTRGNDNKYVIKNYLYENTNGSMNGVELSDVPEYENVPQEFKTNSEEKLFVINTPNVVNNIDATLPMGISIYANAIDQLKNCDNIFDSFNNDFVLGRKRVAVQPEAVKNLQTGEPLFDPNDLVFYIMPEGTKADTIITPLESSLRVTDHNLGMQTALNMLSMKCGFGDNHWKFNAGNITTATQVISANSDMFRTLKKHEQVLERVLKELVRIILRLGNTYMNAGLNEDVEMSIDFDDSIIEDDATEFSRDVQMLGMGIIQPYEFRMRWLNEDEETAKAALPQMEQLAQGEIV